MTRGFDDKRAMGALAALGGIAILASGKRRAERLAIYGTIVGLIALGMAVRKPAAAKLRAVGTRRREAHLRFSFVVDRPVEQVFAFCANFENFPKFIGRLREVRDTGDGRSRWSARTPSGGPLEWDAVTTKFVTNSVIGWKSVGDSPVETTGMLRFSPEESGTCVRVAVDYCVVDGRLRDALAALVQRSSGAMIENSYRAFEANIPDVPRPAVVA